MHMASLRSVAEFKQQTLVFQTPNGKTLTVTPLKLTLVTDSGAITACQLVFSVTPLEYARISQEKLFHLKTSMSVSGSRKADARTTIEVALDPRIAPDLAMGASDAQAAQDLILRKSEDETSSPLVSSQSWLAKAVRQA
jgi:hypothetical protein